MRICHMGHHGIKILCGFSFYSTEYFRGAGSCAFWLMRLLAFNLWHIVPSVSAPSELSIYIDIYCVPTSLQGCEDHYSAQYSWSSITAKRAKNSKHFFLFVNSLQQFGNLLIHPSLFIALPSRNELHQLPTWQKDLAFYFDWRGLFRKKTSCLLSLNYPRLILSAQ